MTFLILGPFYLCSGHYSFCRNYLSWLTLHFPFCHFNNPFSSPLCLPFLARHFLICSSHSAVLLCAHPYKLRCLVSASVLCFYPLMPLDQCYPGDAAHQAAVLNLCTHAHILYGMLLCMRKPIMNLALIIVTCIVSPYTICSQFSQAGMSYRGSTIADSMHRFA